MTTTRKHYRVAQCVKHKQGYYEDSECSACAAENVTLAPIPAPEPDVMTVDEGAALLRISREHLYDAIGRGEVPHRRIGRSIRLSRAALMRWLEGSCEAAHQKGMK